jgi:hypothetical protein
MIRRGHSERESERENSTSNKDVAGQINELAANGRLVVLTSIGICLEAETVSKINGMGSSSLIDRRAIRDNDASGESQAQKPRPESCNSTRRSSPPSESHCPTAFDSKVAVTALSVTPPTFAIFILPGCCTSSLLHF